VSRADVVAVIPAYQAAATIGAVVAGVLRRLARVVVVDDGSSDATGEAARRAGATVERLETKRGKGVALRRGIELALALEPGALVLLDADGQHDPADLDALLAAWDARRPDLIVGARLADPEKIPPARYWTNYIGSRILSWMCGLDLEDTQSGYRLLAAPLARALELASEGYAIESEMLIKAARRGARIEHVRVRTIYNDGVSHFRPLRDTVRISCASIYFKVFDD
jgi:glycosyltransferase involved in cell wall biosynthesis